MRTSRPVSTTAVHAVRRWRSYLDTAAGDDREQGERQQRQRQLPHCGHRDSSSGIESLFDDEVRPSGGRLRWMYGFEHGITPAYRDNDGAQRKAPSVRRGEVCSGAQLSPTERIAGRQWPACGGAGAQPRPASRPDPFAAKSRLSLRITSSGQAPHSRRVRVKHRTHQSVLCSTICAVI
jgi:hypothetical protein